MLKVFALKYAKATCAIVSKQNINTCKKYNKGKLIPLFPGYCIFLHIGVHKPQQNTKVLQIYVSI